MSEFDASRRDVLKSASVAALSLAGLSASSVPAAAHEKIDQPATDLLGPIQVPANSDRGFNYPYYLYLPETAQDEPVPMLVEPNNSGFPSDNLEEHRSVVKNQLADGMGPPLYSRALVAPLLLPVFPRPAGEIAPSGTYTHALDEDSVTIEGTEVDRVDLQLISMIEHAQELLADLSYPVADDVMMNGFSATGNFVNRFAALHPEMVRSLSAGGINGTPILPLEQADGERLDYPIGVEDFEEITGEPFDTANWREVAQFLYMGEEDENDTIPYDDAWSDRHQEVAVEVYGEDMQADRMPYAEQVYEDAGADTTYKIYDGVGHSALPLQIQEDIANFHRRAAELKQVAFETAPEVGDTTVQFETFVFDNRDLQVRVRSAERGDITEQSAEVRSNERATPTVSLASGIEENEEITGIVLPTGTSDSSDAVASVGRLVRPLPLLDIVDIAAGSPPSITLEYGVSERYSTESALHLYVSDSSGGRQLVTTFPPGASGEETFELSADELDVDLEMGTTVSAAIVDIDDGSSLASASGEIGSDGGTEQPDVASVEFASQPTDELQRLEVTHSLAADYESTGTTTLQAQIGDDTEILLGTPTTGEEITEEVSVEKIPIDAGSDITVNVVDGESLASDGTVVLRDTNGDVSVSYTNVPTEDDQSATVEYSVGESYDPTDALTLRVYEGTLQGDDPGEPVALLSPGDSGTETFTIGEDTDAAIDDPVVAIVDDVPLARAVVADVVDQQDRQEADEQAEEDEQTGDESDATENKEDGDSEEQATQDDADSTSSDDTGPGFGIGGALAGIGGVGYLLRSRVADDQTDAE